MSTLPAGTQLSIRSDAVRRLAFPPAPGSTLLIAVHQAALPAPASSHTQLVGLRHGDVVWAGALSEHLLTVEAEGAGDPRQLLAEAVGVGARLWDLVWPGDLRRDPRQGVLGTTYQGERPWVVIGCVEGGDLLAAPLNDAANPKWFTPVLTRDEVRMPGSVKRCQLELGHLWGLPRSLGAVGSVAPGARERIMGALRSYF